MLNKLKKARLEKSNSDKGFTIIEVMIVLAIAGLILLIVFLAVPALQRNSRNTQRKDDAGRLAALIGEYESNNNGKAPTAFGSASGALDLTSENFSIINKPTTVSSAASGTPAADTVQVITYATCNGTGVTTGAASSRSIVVYYGLEGATTSGCVPAGS
jgi:prepilin-type N-terminal cleavage/methylation domain-containing protein